LGGKLVIAKITYEYFIPVISFRFINMKNYILTREVAGKKLRRMAYEILESNFEESQLVLAGIRESGRVIAKNIQQVLKEITNIEIQMITISLDKRDPREVTLSEKVDFTNKVIILVDDVANSGKTLSFALKPFLDFQPKKIQTLVLVERSHKVFPVHPDYVGLSVSTTLQEHIYVEVEGDVVTGAYLQ